MSSLTQGAHSKRSQGETRSGSGALALLAVPLNGTILRQLANGPMRLAELRRDNGSAPQTTVRAHLKGLEVEGLMSKQGRAGSPGIAEYALTGAGRDLLVVVVALEHWLRAAPEGPVVFGSDAGKTAIKALADGWSSTILRTLATDPRSLSQLAKVIGVVSYPTLERQLRAMRLAGQLVASPNEGEGTPYGLTEWLRQGVAPLAAAVRWERSHFPDETPTMTRLDTEAAFLLALPQLRMTVALAGSCRMGVEMNDGDARLCGVIAQVEKGLVVSSTANLAEEEEEEEEEDPDAWATGSEPAWADALLGTGNDRLNLGGNHALASGLLDGLQGTLFGGN